MCFRTMWCVPKASTLRNHGSGKMGRIAMETSLGGTHSLLNHDGRKSSIPLLTIHLGCQETVWSTNTWTPRTSTSGQAWLNLGCQGKHLWWAVQPFVKRCSSIYIHLSIHNQCLWIYGLILLSCVSSVSSLDEGQDADIVVLTTTIQALWRLILEPVKCPLNIMQLTWTLSFQSHRRYDVFLVCLKCIASTMKPSTTSSKSGWPSCNLKS